LIRRPYAPDESRATRIGRRSLTSGDWILCFGMGGLAALGFGTLVTGAPSPVRVGWLICGLIVLLAVSSIGSRRGNPPQATFLLVCGGYLVLKIAALALGPYPAAIADFMDAYKAYIFLPVVIWFAGRRVFSPEGVALATKTLLLAFAVKYSASIAMGSPRPIMWVENNFELMTLIGFTYLAFNHLGPRRNLWVAVLVAVVLASSSRSGLAELCVCLTLLYWRPQSKAFLLSVLSLPAVGWWALRVVESRTVGGVRATDRWRFFELFQYETRSWSASEWLLGAYPLTPLSSATCGELAFWRALFATLDGGTCYSVIFHAYALRAVFDHGVVGVLFLLWLLWLALRMGGVSARDRLALICLGVVNSLSVSAFNSEYLMLVFVIAAGIDRGKAARTEMLADVSEADPRHSRFRDSPAMFTEAASTAQPLTALTSATECRRTGAHSTDARP
jgi:hypothetical protein